MMGSREFIEFAKKAVSEYYGKTVMPEDVYVVWSCKILQNNKALLSTPEPDGMYYEVTYNGDKGEAYIDAYRKMSNECIRTEGGEDGEE